MWSGIVQHREKFSGCKKEREWGVETGMRGERVCFYDGHGCSRRINCCRNWPSGLSTIRLVYSRSRNFFPLIESWIGRASQTIKNWLWTFDPLANYESLKKLILISFKVILSIDFLTVHSQLLSRRFQKCMGEFLRWFFRMIFSRSWDPNSEGQSMVKSTILQCYFPSPVVALNADLVVAMLQKSVQASTVLRKRCVRLRFVIRNGIWDLAKTWRHLNFVPDMIQWRKTYVQDESRDAYSNFRLCCNSDPWLDLG